MEVGEENDSCIKMGSDANYFNVSLIVGDSHKIVSTDHNFFKRMESQSRNKPRTFCLPD